MNAGKYTVKEFFENRYLRQVIVPEIQRDYVWPEKPLLGLLASLQEAFAGFNAFEPFELNDKALEASFKAYQQRLAHSASIGFVYAYSDEEYPGRYFLIDGQQRLTSLLLMLLALAHRQPELREPFRRIFYDEDKALKLDYKVREASHDFLSKLVAYLLSVGTENVEDQTWHYTAATTDVTVQNLLRNFQRLQQAFDAWDCEGFDTGAAAETAFFKYLTDYTEFYYFDTNLSEQGEDLYIYMNARGEQMQSNENLKAELLGALKTPDEKEAWGIKWEQWQDFFWQHRAAGGSNNPNADAGFNEFLACIAGLTKHLKAGPLFNGPEAPLQNIERYVACLQFLARNKQGFKNGYNYSGWVDKCWHEIWGILNKEKNDWQKDHRRRAFIWPMLHFMTQRDHSDLSAAEVFRVLRVHYLRYHNHFDSISGLEAENSERLHTGVFRTNGLVEEETLKHKLYACVEPAQLAAYEAVVWEIEDHPFNLDGSGVGRTNISHLIDLDSVTSLEFLHRVRDKFYDLLPLGNGTRPLLQNILLHYGPYQHRESPWYYFNYNFGDWKRTVRGRGSEEAGSTEKVHAFRRFLTDFLNADVSLDDFSRTHTTPISKEAAVKHHHMALWYSQLIPLKMWGHGTYLAFSNDWAGNDTHFPACRIIYNTGGSFRGYNNGKLQALVPSLTAE